MLTLTLVGDTVISLWITTTADRIGRKNMLIAGAGLMLLAGVAFVLTKNFWLLLAAATIGVISPSGTEVGPFLAIEQAALSHLTPSSARTATFAWYNLAGSFATAMGSLVAGFATQMLQNHGMAAVDSYRIVLAGYAVVGALLTGMCLWISAAVEVEKLKGDVAAEGPVKLFLGLHRSRGVVMKLSAMFAARCVCGGICDAVAGGVLVQR